MEQIEVVRQAICACRFEELDESRFIGPMEQPVAPALQESCYWIPSREQAHYPLERHRQGLRAWLEWSLEGLQQW